MTDAVFRPGQIATRRALASAAFVVLVSSGLTADNWPQWRGPSSHGVSPETGLPTTWSVSQNVAWRAPLAGLGTSSPIVRDDRVFVTSQSVRGGVVGGEHPQLARDDARSPIARADWRPEPEGGSRRYGGSRTGMARRRSLSPIRRPTALGASHRSDRGAARCPRKHNLATPTPATDGKRVYAWFGNGQIVVLDVVGRPPGRASRLGVSRRSSAGDMAAHLRCSAIWSFCCATTCPTRICWRSMRARAASAGRWIGDGAVSHSTRWSSGARGDELLVNSSERIDAYDPATGMFCGTRAAHADADSVGRVPGRADLSQSRVSQQRLHGDQARRAGRRHGDARRVAGAPAPCTCRRSSTTTACST